MAGSSGSLPAIACSNMAAVRTSFAIGPGVSWLWLIGTTCVRLTRPTVGFSPTMPLSEAGQVIDPSVSVPMAASVSPAATAVLLTLVDGDTPLWLAPALATPDACEALRFHTSAPLVAQRDQAAFAVVLSLSDRALKAADALDRVQRLGGRPEEFLNPADVRAIREAAATEWTTRFWLSIALAAVIGAAVWITAMFALGAVLAACVPRVPVWVGATGHALSRREVWLERFYLVVLSLGLLVFYVSVPVVAFGLLAK